MTAASMRLHITPFTPDLLQAVVGPRLLDQVSGVSYHTIQTFPENSYGYLELPTMEAEKIKKKLNGAILKGRKIKIDEARPNKRRRLESPTEEPPKRRSAISANPAKKDRNVLAGHELPSDRKVKRGWTEANPVKAGKKTKGRVSSSTSKYTDKNELLFRTKLPPNKAESGKKVKAKKGSGQHVVHEFEHATIQPSFLRQDGTTGAKRQLEYVEGRGWVDESGEVVEAESGRAQMKREVLLRQVSTHEDNAHSSGSSSAASTSTSTSSSDEEDEVVGGQDEDETSSSGSSSDSDSDDSTSVSTAEDDKVPSVVASDPEPAAPAEVHPLEALFKKPNKPASQDVAKPSLEVATTFSFFQASNEEDVDEGASIPGTPFSLQDMRFRGLRSGAPTPDTAYPSRFNSYGSSGLPGDEELEEDEDEDEDGADDDAASAAALDAQKHLMETPSRKQSEFEKKFWQNRGDNNRAWKLRRRSVLKEKRQRENKARRPKNW
ncbi:hypothetical protein HRR83_002124 [Exophiala dermatitidis]|uniref:RRM domain-containing protein n=2 Tax=Exophiala dermatitidis TaxID=5970 RepID=H6BYT2_EXODN|nr:uncharacterized protein HMPREF1120_04861 [Exophiala dermatitidis NIH/UT8656]KAJ4520159.1 hypothetical protein HRR75_002022 [Exophiala dermatitidis]EHY56795.1 hypothetical protein HMPREF1120_04861 [Exophiala dermatitidis NIH/UT8656]KAJ4524006.1 hypothetical protein HRR74_002201 [Exophiala dermatitidis]KAJ4525724.1 hypothetical protein HRR73_002456 [Exophiala dermatitidis]KAJ4537049.1 hypothetical protein HRR76_005067 [Exophiala dermatitidis]